MLSSLPLVLALAAATALPSSDVAPVSAAPASLTTAPAAAAFEGPAAPAPAPAPAERNAAAAAEPTAAAADPRGFAGPTATAAPLAASAPPPPAPDAVALELLDEPPPAPIEAPLTVDAVALDDAWPTAGRELPTAPPRAAQPSRDLPPDGVPTGRGELIAAGFTGGLSLALRVASIALIVDDLPTAASTASDPLGDDYSDGFGDNTYELALFRVPSAALSLTTWALTGSGATKQGRYSGWRDAARGTPAPFDVARERVAGRGLIVLGLVTTTFAATAGLFVPPAVDDDGRTGHITSIFLNDVAHITGSALVTVGAYKLGRANGYALGHKQGSTWGRVSELRVAPQAALGGGGLSLSGRF
jgi:hypothetical protein